MVHLTLHQCSYAVQAVQGMVVVTMGGLPVTPVTRCYGVMYPRYILARNVDTAAAGHWCQVPPPEPGPVVTSYLLSLTYSAVALTTIQA